MEIRRSIETIVFGAIALSFGRCAYQGITHSIIPPLDPSCISAEINNSETILRYYLPEAEYELNEEEITLLKEKDKARHAMVENIVELLSTVENGINSGKIKLKEEEVVLIRDDIFLLLKYIFSEDSDDNEKIKICSRINHYVKCCSNAEDKLALGCFKMLLPKFRETYSPLGKPLKRHSVMEHLQTLAKENQLTVIETVRLVGAALYTNENNTGLDTLAILYPDEYSTLRDKLYNSDARGKPLFVNNK